MPATRNTLRANFIFHAFCGLVFARCATCLAAVAARFYDLPMERKREG